MGCRFRGLSLGVTWGVGTFLSVQEQLKAISSESAKISTTTQNGEVIRAATTPPTECVHRFTEGGEISGILFRRVVVCCVKFIGVITLEASS